MDSPKGIWKEKQVFDSFDKIHLRIHYDIIMEAFHSEHLYPKFSFFEEKINNALEKIVSGSAEINFIELDDLVMRYMSGLSSIESYNDYYIGEEDRI